MNKIKWNTRKFFDRFRKDIMYDAFGNRIVYKMGCKLKYNTNNQLIESRNFAGELNRFENGRIVFHRSLLTREEFSYTYNSDGGMKIKRRTL